MTLADINSGHLTACRIVLLNCWATIQSKSTGPSSNGKVMVRNKVAKFLGCMKAQAVGILHSKLRKIRDRVKRDKIGIVFK